MKDLKKTLKNDLKDFKKLDVESKLYVVFFFIIIIIAAVLTGSSIQSNASTTSAEPATQTTESVSTKSTSTLALSPSTLELKVGEELPVSVVLSKNPVSAIDVVLTYDPAVFSLSNLKNGTVFPKLLTQKMEEGKLTVSASLDPADTKDAEVGEVFSFTLKALAPAEESVVEFNRDSTLTALNGENVLGVTVGGSYKVN